MDETESGPRPAFKRVTSLLHFSQLLFAVAVLGLDAYCIHYINYNVLIFSMVAVLCTIFISVYCFFSRNVSQELLATYSSAPFQRRGLSGKDEEEIQKEARKVERKNLVTLGLYTWTFVFWVVDLGLVASLATIWGEPGCTYNFWNGYRCMPYEKRDLHKRDTTSYGTYYGALVAGTCLAAVQVVLWAGTIAMLLGVMARLHQLNKSRVPLQTSNPPVSGMQEASSQWDGAIPTLRHEATPILPSPEPGYQPSNFFTDPRQQHPQYSMPPLSG